jgi:hypothetical protein
MQAAVGRHLDREQNLSAMRARIRFPGLRTASVRPAPALAWLTIVLDAVLMIVLAWRWAFRGEPYSPLGAVTLSALMLGFAVATTTAMTTLGRPAKTPSPSVDDQSDALMLFPAEDLTDSNRVITSHSLATHQKALL